METGKEMKRSHWEVIYAVRKQGGLREREHPGEGGVSLFQEDGQGASLWSSEMEQHSDLRDAGEWVTRASWGSTSGRGKGMCKGPSAGAGSACARRGAEASGLEQMELGTAAGGEV